MAETTTAKNAVNATQVRSGSLFPYPILFSFSHSFSLALLEQPANGILLQLFVLRVPQRRNHVPWRQVANATLAVLVGPSRGRGISQVLERQPIFLDALQQQELL